MLKRIKRKLASAVRKRTPRDKVYSAVPVPRADSSSDESPSPGDSRTRIPPKGRRGSPQSEIVAKPDTRVKKLTKPENVSCFRLDSNYCKPLGGATRPPPGPNDKENDDPQCPVTARGNVSQHEVEDSLIEDEAAKLITPQTPSRKLRALLLLSCTLQRTQALVHARQDLRAVGSELATTAAELESLVGAKSSLEDEDSHEVPGAFFDDDACVERERRKLLMPTLERKIGLCRQDLEDLKAQRPRLEAGLEALQEHFLDDLERAVRNDVAAKASASNVANSGDSNIWWAR